MFRGIADTGNEYAGLIRFDGKDFHLGGEEAPA